MVCAPAGQCDHRPNHADRSAHIDNYIKAILDAINGIVITDDAQIVEINARKIYGTPKTIFTVQPLPERACAVRARNLDFDLTANSEKSNSTAVTNEQ